MKSLVLDSTILRERHKINIGKSLLVLLLCFPQQSFYGKVKNPDKDKIIQFLSQLVEYSNVINYKIQQAASLHCFSCLLVKYIS